MRTPLVLFAVLWAPGCFEASACRDDLECAGDDEICAYGTCEVVACNEDAQCGDHACVDGVCAPAGTRPTDLPAEGKPPVALGWCDEAAKAPAPEAADVDILADVRAVLPQQADIEAVQLTLTDAEGALVRTIRLVDGQTLLAVPMAPLAAGARLTARLSTTGCETTWAFTTLPVDLVDAADHAPRTLSWSASSAEVFPAAAAGLLGVIGPDPLAISFVDGHGVLGFTDEGELEPCEPTLTLEGEMQNPTYALSGQMIGDVSTRSGLRTVSVRGVSTGAGVQLAGVAVIDARLMAHHLLPTCVPSDASYPGCAVFACAIVAEFGLSCTACEDGSPTCVPMALRASGAPFAPVSVRTLADVCAEDTCTDEPACR